MVHFFLLVLSFFWQASAQIIPFAFLKGVSSPPGYSCGGVEDSAYCYYLGVTNTSCVSVCSANGSQTCELTGTQTGASQLDCPRLLGLFGESPGGLNGNTANTWACAINDAGTTSYNNITPSLVDCTSSLADRRRVCACYTPGPDYHVAITGWGNFSNYSRIESIWGINQTVNLQMSVSYGVGTPTIEYNKNGGGFTAFTPGSPATVSFVDSDTLQFRVSGTLGHSASFTVTNLSDGNNIVETMTGTVSTCSGLIDGSYCYFQGELGESCDSVCTNSYAPGLSCDLTGTQAIGALADCQRVAQLFGNSATSGMANNSYAYACAVNGTGAAYRANATTTNITCAASLGTRKRFCSCS